MRVASRYNLYLTTQSAHPLPMPAVITSAVFTRLHLLYTTAFICRLPPCYIYSILWFSFSLCPMLFQTLVQSTNPLSSPLAQTLLGASDGRGLGTGEKEAGSQPAPGGRWEAGGRTLLTKTLDFFRNSRPWNSTVQTTLQYFFSCRHLLPMEIPHFHKCVC